jgi:iron-sulfur cluster repair protein YtfE (RIC family)
MKTEFELPLQPLLYFVKESCHEGLHKILEDIWELASDPDIESLGPLPGFIRDFIQRLKTHLKAEESELFPMIESDYPLPLAYPIQNLIDEHARFDDDLALIRKMTNDFEVQESFDDKIMYFYRRVLELERIILNHIHIESFVLYPMVLKTKLI